MDAEEAVKTGFLFVPYLSFLWKTWTKRFCALYKSSNCGIQRIEVFESEEAFVKLNPSKIIPLVDCIKVSSAPQKQQANVFEVRTKDNVHTFSAETFQDMTDWLAELQKVAFGEAPKLHQMATKDEKHEENMLYSSMDEPEVFSVIAVSTEANQRNELFGCYKLVVTALNVSIAEESPQGNIGKILLTWPYRHIRRYGYTTENFSFEAGRKCASGEGLFTFSTPSGMIIFQSIDTHVSALKSTHNESEISRSLNLNGENFFGSADSLTGKREALCFFSDADPFDSDTSVFGTSNKKSTLKTTSPVPKPPRKSKPSKLVDTDSMNVSDANEASSKSLKLFIPNEELFSQSSLRNTGLFDSSSLQRKTYEDYEQISESNDANLCSGTEKLSISDASQRPETSAVTSCDYKKSDQVLNRFSILKHDNVYGKVASNRHSFQSTECSTLPGSAILKHSSSVESSLTPPYFRGTSMKKYNKNTSNEMSKNPNHFIKNDSEYAQIFK